MNKNYNKPEFKVVKMKNEDILTDSHLIDSTNGWETIPNNRAAEQFRLSNYKKQKRNPKS